MEYIPRAVARSDRPYDVCMKYLCHISATLKRAVAAAAASSCAGIAYAADAATTASGASSVVASQAALQGSAASGLPPEVLASVAGAGRYDWTLAIALVLGLVGLIWMRRHIANL